MPFVLPFDKEAERILRAIRKNGKAFTRNTQFTRSWARNHPELENFIGIYNNRRRGESVFVPFPDVQIIERPKSKKFEIIKIF